MSQKYPYPNTGDEFLSHQDMYADSYQRQSITYCPTVISSSQEQKCSTTSSNRTVDSPVQLPGMALSFLHSCGLDLNDLAHLAELPEHLITVETLPKLLLQVKESKLSSASSSTPSTSQHLDDTSAHAQDGSSGIQTVEYPINRPAHPVYPLPPEQVQNWQDRWGNPRRSLTTDTTRSSSKSSNVPDYSISKTTGTYSDTKESPETWSHSFADSRPKPLLSLRLEAPVVVPTRKEASDFNCKVPSAFPHVCCLCDISVRSTKEWFLHVRGSEHATSQLELVKKYPKWDQTFESARRNERSEVYTVPTRKEASDFNGTVPPVFPYLCVLCNITAFSEKDWSVHITSGQHATSRLKLMEKYPEWDGTVKSTRRNDDPTTTETQGNTSDMMMSQAKDKLSSRVVSFTPLPAGDGVTTELTAIAKRFGSVKKSLFLSNQGYVEMTCLSEAKRLVEHYSANHLKFKGKVIQVNFSEYNSLREADVNDKTQSRSSRIHRRDCIQKDCPSPKRRRSSEKTHSSLRYRSSPKRRHSSEMTPSSPKRKQSSEKTHSSPKRRHSSERTQSSSKRKDLSEKTHSSSKRKDSSERTHSSPKKRHSSETTQFSPKRRCSSEKTPASPKRNHSLQRSHIKKEDSEKSKQSSSISSQPCHSSSSAAEEEPTKSGADTEEMGSVSNNYVESMDSDSDLEGLEVIADDGEELVHGVDDYESTSDQENLPSEPMDITDVTKEEQEKTEEDSPNADTSEASYSLKEGQKFEEREEQEIKKVLNCVQPLFSSGKSGVGEADTSISDRSHEKPLPSSPQNTGESEEYTKQQAKPAPLQEEKLPQEDGELPKLIENGVTLDEFTKKDLSDCQESDDLKTSIPKTEQIDESESPKEESISKTSAEPKSSENIEEDLDSLKDLEEPDDQPKEEQDAEGVTEDLKETFGKVLEVRNLPGPEDYTDSDFLNIIKRYGDVIHHVLFRTCKKGFVEMALTADAEKVATDSKNKDVALRGKVLKFKVSEKYCELPEEGFNVDSDSDDEEIKEGEMSKESNNNQQSDSLNGNTESSSESLKTDEPIGTEFVRPVVGYFCNLCNVIFASEEEAKDEHCRSSSHHEKVTEHKERTGSVVNKK